MQDLTKAEQGTYTIKWIFGIPEVLEQMHCLQIEQGSVIQVIHKYKDYLMIGTDSKRVVIGNDVAGRIKV